MLVGPEEVSPSLILVAHPVPLRGAIPDFAILQNRGQQAAHGDTSSGPAVDAEFIIEKEGGVCINVPLWG